WLALEGWAIGGGVVVLAGVPDGAPARLGIEHAEPLCAKPSQIASEALAPLHARLAGLAHPAALGESWHAEITCDGKPVVARLAQGDGTLLLVADPDLLSNASLSAGDNAAVVLALLGEARNVHVVDRVTGAGAENPYRAVQN